MAPEQSRLFTFAVRRGVKVCSTHSERVQNSKFRTFTGNPTKCSGKPSGVFATKYVKLLLDPSKTKMLFYLAMRRASSADGNSISTYFFKPAAITPSGTHEAHLVLKIPTVAADEDFLTIKALKAESCDEVRPSRTGLFGLGRVRA